MNYLLDTNIVSNLGKRVPHPLIDRWVERQSPETLYISSITIAELRRGVELSQRRHPPSHAHRLGTMLDALQRYYARRILPFEEVAAHHWGVLSAIYPNHPLDAQIASIALAQRATLVTTDQDFQYFARVLKEVGVELRILNPTQEV